MAKVLICDDAIFMRKLIRETLENAGHVVVAEAEDGSLAPDLYNKYRPDIVTMDILMLTSGVDAIRKIVAADPRAKVVIVSVLSDRSGDIVEAIKAGAKGIVAKPINRQVLSAEITRVLAL